MDSHIRREPAMIVAVVAALIGVLTAFGVALTEGQVSAILALVAALIPIAQGWMTRSLVYSPATLEKHADALYRQIRCVEPEDPRYTEQLRRIMEQGRWEP